MEDLDHSREDDLEAGLAAGFGATSASVLRALEARTSASLPRVLLRPPPGAGGQPLTHGRSAGAPPTPVGRASYQIHGEIARGGMGILLEGRDVDLGRVVALKVLREDLAQHPSIVQRFVEEAQIAGQLQHPGIVPVYEMGLMADQRPYFAMKLVRGRTLAAALRERAGASRATLVDAFAAVCRTLAYAHSRGVVHRDLKPSNVLLGDFGEVQVIDWGLAKVLPAGGVTDDARRARTGQARESTIVTVRSGPGSGEGDSLAGSVMGTPAYMSPEQARGEVDHIDERSDVFALGAILCEILTGEPPYRGESERTLLQAARADIGDAEQRLAACDADPALVELCRACLAPVPAQRPRSAHALARRLDDHLASLGERARRAEVRAAEARVRARWTIGACLTAALLVLVAGARAWSVREERAARVHELEGAVQAALAEARLADERQDWSAANAALAESRARVADPLASEALRAQAAELATRIGADERASRARLERERDDALWRAELEDVRQPEGDTVYPTDWAELDRRYAALFAKHGVRIDERQLGAVGHALAERGIVPELAAALDEWSAARWRALDAPGALALTRLTDDLDNDPVRQRLRAARVTRDDGLLASLASSAREADLPSSTLRLLAHELRARGSSAQAIELLETGRTRYPDDYALAMELGRALRSCTPARPEEALGHYRAALALRPDHVEAWHELGMTLYPLSGRAAEAAALFRAAQLRFPNDGHVCFHLGTALATLGQNEEALVCLQRAVELEPGFARTHCNLGAMLDTLGRRDEAIAAYEQALAIDPSLADAHHDLGVALRKQGRYEEALASLARAIELQPRHARAHSEMAYIHLVQGELELAIEAARESIALDGRFPYDYFCLGRALAGTGRESEARAALERCLALDPGFTTAREDLAFLLLGAEDAAVRDAAVALEHARSLARGTPVPATAPALLALALYANGEHAQALEALGPPEPAEGDPLRALLEGLCAWHSGRQAEARERIGSIDLAALVEAQALLGPFVEEARALLERR